MFRQIKVDQLPTYLAKIERVFPKMSEDVAPDNNQVIAYYENSFWGYRAFHSASGAIHMALSESRFHKNDYFAQPERILSVTSTLDNVTAGCELGCGQGFNLAFLAENMPDVQWTGFDITRRNLAAGRKRFHRLANFCLVEADFHALRSVANDSFDVVFAIESICHATDMDKVLAEMYRITRHGGRVIVFDGFRGVIPADDIELTKAVQYVERAMAVPQFVTQETFEEMSLRAGFNVVTIIDRSDAIMPNLVRLSDLAKGFFKIPALTRLLRTVLPAQLVGNAVAGLLMPITVSRKAHRYCEVVLAKE